MLLFNLGSISAIDKNISCLKQKICVDCTVP